MGAAPGHGNVALTRSGQAGGAAVLALVLAFVAALTIASVWAFQRAGYTPCELCLLERNPFYAAVPVGLAVALAARAGYRRLAAVGFAILAFIFLASAGLAAFHAGVEWKLWAGPTGCTGAVQAVPDVASFMKQLGTVKVVRCDEPSLRVFGLSLAAWNVLVSLLLLLIAGLGWRAAARA